MKVSIIGGGGLVGSCAGFALQAGKIVREITLIDLNQEQCEGQALELLHGASLMADQKITAAGTPPLADSDRTGSPAGVRRKPRPSRVELLTGKRALVRRLPPGGQPAG